MKGKSMAAMITILFLILPLVAVPVASAKQRTLGGIEVIRIGSFNNWDHWTGPMVGDIMGTAGFWETDGGSHNYIVGNTMYFFETFTITTRCGTMSGTDDGTWNLFSNLKFTAHGPVTAATGCLANLGGYTFHETGFTTNPNGWPPTVNLLVGVALWSLTP